MGSLAKDDVHPLAAYVFSVMIVEGDRLTLTATGAAAVAAELERYLGGGAIKRAILELMKIAYVLEEQQGNRGAADRIVEVIRRARPALERVGVRFSGLAESRLERARQVRLGTTASKVPVGHAGIVDGRRWWEVK